MFTFARRFRATLLLAALASALVLADPASHDHKRVDHGRRHHALNVTIEERDGRIQKRFDNTRFTYFPTGLNACGSFDHDSDFIVALNTHQWDGGSHCYEEITVEYQGKTAQAKITDECMECPYAAIDFSPGLFLYLIPGGFDQGTAYGSWNYGTGDAASETKTSTTKKPTSTSKPPPSTTSTSTTHTSTKHSTTTTSTSTSTSHSTHSTTSTTSSSTSTSSAPTATVTSWDTGVLNQFNLALISLVELSQAALANPNQV
ncbi:hypothetical protein L226DRAFT_519510 [Lentinus tigrinus ALCF2SS1-7]|uniref:RlpA-like protein double-psi beta-barrel domain-containing protein n=1 Tax=Lentinus tigrinus ALCF2SS1-6 TaxID=1328759 RepID=A0A5C2SRI0_9APHY|nr:hypothetical protein L227DRAFT_569882 [Lentinus tigrinus ALCF2SS1-6]RPD79887.1 hypothetical protein L226DRAFT_519510 [Lentinus tigrinus ALCF2SS1-7]